MAKTSTFSLTNSRIQLRQFYGLSIYWGNASNSEDNAGRLTVTTFGGVNDVVKIGKGGDSPTVLLSRVIVKIDLSSLPLNAVIQSAIFELTTRNNLAGFGWSTTQFPFAIYRIFQTPDMTDANMPSRDATGPVNWAQYGMGDGQDYRNIAEATFTFNTTTDDGVSVKRTLDLTSLIRYAVTTDSRQALFLVSRTDAHQRALPAITIGASNNSQIGMSYNQAEGPLLTVTYTDALTHHPADDAGAIDELVEIDTTDNGIFNFDPVRVGTSGGAKKFFVKNRLSSSATNLKVYSRRSYGSAVYEFERIATGTGLLSDISTVDKSADATNYTRSERWRIIFEAGDVALSQFHVYRDNGTLDDPAVADLWSAATPATGTLGVAYLSTNRGVGFTLATGGTAFVDGDEVKFRTYEDDAHPASPADSDDYLEVAPDATNTPGNWQPLEWKRTPISGAVSNSTVVPVPDVTLFSTGQTVKFLRRADGLDLGSRVVSAVGVSSITVDSNITLASGDYVEPVPIGVATIAALGTFPYWLRTKAPIGAVRESKYPRWRGEAD